MNKLTFLELMKAPDKIADADFVELEILVKANPYFQNGHCVLANAGRRLKKSNSSKMMSTAAIYSTNRNIFKQYIQGQLKFGSLKVKTETAPKPKPATSTPTTPSPRKAPKLNSDTEQDALVKEIYENLEKWKASREHYLDYDRKHPEEIVIEDPFSSSETKDTSAPAEEPKPAPEPIASNVEKVVDEETPVSPAAEGEDHKSDLTEVEKLKNQVAEEIEAEEESISKALSEITQKGKEEEIVEAAAEEEEEEHESTSANIEEKPESENSPMGISSEELTAIVDAESSEEPSEPDKEEGKEQDLDIADEIEQSIVPESSQPKAEENAADTDTELKEEPTTVETSAEPETYEVEDTPDAEEPEEVPANEEEEVSIPIQIETTSDKSTEETEEELDQIGKEIQNLKLTPGSTPTGKKFRLGVLKRGTKFTKEKVKKTSTSSAVAKKPTAKKTETKKTTAKKTEVKKIKEPSKTVEKKAAAKTKTEKKPATTKKATSKTAKETTSKTSKETKTAAKKATTTKKATATKKTASKKASTAKASETKSKKATTKKTTEAKKATPKFRMSASIGSKVTKKKTTKKAPKKDDDTSSEKKKPKKVASASKSAKTAKSDQSNIIDSFIELNPSIKVSKDKQPEEAPVEDLAARHEAFPDDLVTENLASILVGQGKVEKAISIYEKLILKNPQKKAYFASQIEKLNKK